MKSLIVFVAVTTICAGSAIPSADEAYSSTPGDNSHYVEGKSRYIWMPDGEGVPHLVDLQATAEDDLLWSATRDGANNQYWLYTRRNQHNAQVIVHGDLFSLFNSNYDGNLPLKVIVHGWNNDGNSPMNPTIRDAFLDVQDCNVVVVDWSKLAGGLYTLAVWGVPNVGEHVGNFVTWLINNTRGDWNQVHLVGFSLGAHVVGNAGREVGGRIARITGLDPAGPQWGGNSNALNQNDGQYVETIHTDGGFLGIFDRIADADFYPNGGSHPQPGCWLNTCSHGRAPDLFAATVRYNHLIGRGCSDVSQVSNPSFCTGFSLMMGNGIVTKRGSGIFSLTTGNTWPFYA